MRDKIEKILNERGVCFTTPADRIQVINELEDLIEDIIYDDRNDNNVSRGCIRSDQRIDQ
jgi:hypothetical protein